MVEVGDRVLVESEKVGSVTRSGVVTAVDDQLITVRWDSGSESVFVPQRRVPSGHRPRAAHRAGRQVLSCQRRRRAPHPRAPLAAFRPRPAPASGQPYPKLPVRLQSPDP